MYRTGYSFKYATGHLKDVMERMKALGMKSAPIADRMSTFAFNRWTKLAKKEGLRPVYGVELPVARKIVVDDEEPVIDWWTFMAVDDLAPLHELIWQAGRHPGKFPHVSVAQAIDWPGLIKITGDFCMMDALASHNTPVGFYIGASPATPKATLREALERGYSLCARSSNVYPTEADKEFYRVLLGKGAFSQTYPQHILSDAEWNEVMSDKLPAKELSATLANRDTIIDSCTASLQKAKLLVPEKLKTLRQMCEEGAQRLGCDLSNPIYSARLDRELKLIDEKKFEDYFYIIADMVMWAKERMIVGPARGSSCGSLACYLMGITAIDPIPYNLLFERFIDTTRSDLPDVDIDFSDEQRQKVFDYIEKKYGEERVARLGSVGTFMPKSALHQAGIALRIPRFQIERVLDNIIQRSSGDSRALQQIEDTLKDTEAGRTLMNDHPQILIAGRMEGHPNAPSQHAAGIVLTEGRVRDVVAVDARTKATMCDKKDAEDYNLLKIDALGLTQLSVFERAQELIGQPRKSGFLETVPLDDPLAFEVLNKGHFSGIFQFMGGALQSLAKQTTFTSLNDIVSITALARPGPMATGGAGGWVKRKRGQEPVTYAHPIVEPYLRETLGIVVYQEQVMQIAREVGELSWDDVTSLRKAMSKSLGEEFFNRYGDPWKKKAIEKGMPPDVAKKFWDDLCAFGSWGFNKSHAVAYGMVSYWCCWFKAHHPLEFAAATLDAESDPVKQIQLLREQAAEGVGYVPFDRDHSGLKWEIAETKDGKRQLVGPVTNIKGIGPATAEAIINHRKDKKLKLGAKALKLLDNPKTAIDSLYPVAARVKELHPDLRAINIVSEPTNIIDVKADKTMPHRSVLVIGVAQRIVPRDVNELVYVAKRGGRKISGDKTRYLNLFMRDDTDEMYCKVDRFMMEALGDQIIERGRPGKAIYAIKGTVPGDFRMISITNVRYLGDLDDDAE